MTMMMREKMARAMCVRAGIDADAKGYGTDQDGNRCDPFMWQLYLPQIDAALAALATENEFTGAQLNAMCDAFTQADTADYRPYDGAVNGPLSDNCVRVVQAFARAAREGK